LEKLRKEKEALSEQSATTSPPVVVFGKKERFHSRALLVVRANCCAAVLLLFFLLSASSSLVGVGGGWEGSTSSRGLFETSFEDFCKSSSLSGAMLSMCKSHYKSSFLSFLNLEAPKKERRRRKRRDKKKSCLEGLSFVCLGFDKSGDTLN